VTRVDAERTEIEAAIPHRAPFLFIDRILERHADGLAAEWRVPLEAEWFRGHYPGEPVLPGVLLCEHVFQCAALFVASFRGAPGPEDGIPVLTRIADARFRRIVRPGETLRSRVTLTEQVGPAFVFQGRSAVDGAPAVRLEFVLASTGGLARGFAQGEA